jgi:hypothetical protein
VVACCAFVGSEIREWNWTFKCASIVNTKSLPRATLIQRIESAGEEMRSICKM